MFKYKFFVDGDLISEGDDTEFNQTSADLAAFGIGNAPIIQSKEDMKAAIEGKMIALFMDQFKTDPIYETVMLVSASNFTLGGGMLIASFLDFLPRVSIDITEE